MKSERIKSMGVINITPDSFSDGNQFNSLEAFEKKLLDSLCFDLVDIGAESTAPFNNKVAADDEIERWKKIALPILAKHKSKIKNISIDTYKAKTIAFLLEWFTENIPEVKLVWNDVSGVLDSETIEVLKSNPNLGYVLSFTYVPTKDRTQYHMEYVKEEDILYNCCDFIITNKERLKSLKNRFIFDPCFGFSKSRAQNYELLKGIKEVELSWKGEMMIGISRKSFTRAKNLTSDKGLLSSEVFHALWLNNLSEKLSCPVYFRVHDLNILEAVQRYRNC